MSAHAHALECLCCGICFLTFPIAAEALDTSEIAAASGLESEPLRRVLHSLSKQKFSLLQRVEGVGYSVTSAVNCPSTRFSIKPPVLQADADTQENLHAQR